MTLPLTLPIVAKRSQSPMQTTRNPSTHAAAWKARVFAALRAEPMVRSRTLEATGGAQ